MRERAGYSCGLGGNGKDGWMVSCQNGLEIFLPRHLSSLLQNLLELKLTGLMLWGNIQRTFDTVDYILL